MASGGKKKSKLKQLLSVSDEVITAFVDGPRKNVVVDTEKEREPMMATSKRYQTEAEAEVRAHTDDSRCCQCSGLLRNNRGLTCAFCTSSYHENEKCSGVKTNNFELFNSPHVLYTCQDCLINGNTTKGKAEELITAFHRKLDDVQSVLVDTMDKGFDLLVNGIKHDANAKPAPRTYANIVKEKPIPKPKNTLVIKATSTGKAANNKVEIVKQMDTPIDYTKSTYDGHVVVGFANKETLDRAKSNLESRKNELNISVLEKRKLWPKIKVCNISTEEDDEEIISNILSRNNWLESVVSSADEFKFVTSVPARNSAEKHCIIKCSPKIRKLIMDKDDYLYTLLGRNKVYDSYRYYQCFRCQGFDHSSSTCSRTQVCAICSQDHRMNECTSNERKCVNCDHYGRASDHKANDMNCPRIQEELARIKNRTDHGLE